MPDIDYWKPMIASAAGRHPKPLIATYYLGKTYPSCSRPVLMSCSDGNDYVVKWFNPPRMLFNDQVVGILGRLIGAPVPEVRLVSVPGSLATDSALRHIQGGICHGSQFLRQVSESREYFTFTTVRENRSRFALLAVLYGWAFVGHDHQFLYGTQPPRLVYSHDHGHFFPRGPGWSTASLQKAPTAALDSLIIEKCDLNEDELQPAIQSLHKATNEAIAGAVAAPPEDWGVSLDERVALAEYLASRRDVLISSGPRD